MSHLHKHPVVRGLLTGLLLLTALTGRTQNAVSETPDYTIRSGGIERTYKLHLPPNLPAGAPLVIVLHGYGGNNNPDRFGLNATADRHGFAVCYPQGAKDGRGKSCWNVGYPFQEKMTIDDVKFLTELVRHLQKKHALSRRNVFCTGMSNGGEMCYQLAAERPRLFAAVAPVSGLMLQWLCKADTSKAPVPLFEIHGTEDKTSAWLGDPQNKGGWGAYLPVPLAVHYWAAKARCTAMQIDTLPAQRPGGRRIVSQRFTDGADGCEVWLYQIVGGTHSWGEKDLDTGEALWKFFSKFVK